MPDIPVPDAKATIVKVGETTPTGQTSRDWSDDLSHLFLLLQRMHMVSNFAVADRNVIKIVQDESLRPAGREVATATLPTTSTVNWMHVWVGPVDQRWEMIQRSNIEYNECQRSKFTFA